MREPQPFSLFVEYESAEGITTFTQMNYFGYATAEAAERDLMLVEAVAKRENWGDIRRIETRCQIYDKWVPVKRFSRMPWWSGLTRLGMFL